MFLEFIALILITIIPRLLFTLWGDDDSIQYSWIIEKERSSGYMDHAPFRSFQQGKIVLPALLPRLVSYFPSSSKFFVARVLVILFDVLLVGVSYFVARYCLSFALGVENQRLLLSHEFLIATLISTAPILFPHSARIKAIGARTFGSFLGFLYFLSLGYWVISGEYWILAILFFLFIAITLSSLFTLQAVILLSLLYSVVSFNLDAILILVGSIIISIVIKPFGARIILLRFAISKWVWYFRNQDSKGITKRNSLRNLFSIPLDLYRNSMKAFSTIFAQNSFLIALHSFPLLFICLYLIINQEVIEDYSWIHYSVNLIISSIIVFLLTSLKRMLFLGQAERYLEYVLIPVNILVYIWIVTKYPEYSSDFVMIVLLYNISLIFLSALYEERFNIKNKWNQLNVESFDRLMIQFKKTEKSGNIITFSSKLAWYFSLHTPDEFKFFFPWVSTEELDCFREMENDLRGSTNLIDDVPGLISKYNVDYLIFENALISKYTSLNSCKLSLVIKSNEFTIYRVNVSIANDVS